MTVSFLPDLKVYDNRRAIGSAYAGSFAGMTGLNLFSNYYDYLILTLFVGVYLTLLSSTFKGYGGKLGAVSFVSVLSFVFLKGFL